MRVPRWSFKAWPTLLLLFLLVFPKGGIKIADVPLTWGYLLLGLTAIFFLMRKEWILSRPSLLILAVQIPFQLTALLSFAINGIESGNHAIAFITHFIFFPLCFFGLFSHSIQNINLGSFYKIFRKGVFFIATFGIFLFFFKMITGKFLLIPLLTSNLHDYDVIELTKCIARGDFFKLISTYNNGNIYGICLLMILPFYQTIEESQWKKRLVKLSLILTLSRTIWIGLFIEEIMTQFFVQPLSRRTLFNLISRWAIFICLIGLILYYLGYQSSFAFDPTLGGRIYQFNVLSEASWVGHIPFVGLEEIVYLSVLNNFGYVGLLTFIISLSAPLLLHLKTSSTSIQQKGLFSGLLLYLIIACSDGAILMIPVMAFYWFTSALLFSINHKPFEINLNA